MIQTVTIKSINRAEKVSQKTNRPYTSLGFQCNEHGSKWINGFGNKDNKDWKEGDEIKVNIFEKDYQGKKYLNFEMVDVKAEMLARLEALEKVVMQLKETVRPLYMEWKEKQPKVAPPPDAIPYPEPDDDEIPF